MKSDLIKKPSSFAILEQALEQLRVGGPDAVGDGFIAVLADRVRAAIEASDGITLSTLTEQLASFYKDLFAAVPTGAREAARGASGDKDAAAAFLLGQAAFAHLLASRTLDRRADDRFLQTIRNGRYERYIRALQRAPLNGQELGKLIGERDETVSRKLTVLRQLGIVSSRKDGTSVINNLTPAAQGVLDHLRIAPLALSAPTIEVQEAVEAMHDKIPAYLRTVPSFGEVARRPHLKVA